MRTSTRVLLFLFLVWLVAGAIMSFSLTPDMAQAFKQRYKVDPSKVYQVVGACTAAIGVLIQLFLYVPKRPQCDDATFNAHAFKEFARHANKRKADGWHAYVKDQNKLNKKGLHIKDDSKDEEGRISLENGEDLI
jgi:hypothetical protein